ncbi:hypothetical protein BDQ17DRAFT_1347656 [Cyathus striatus]|nr:hypothetical protein BDQ17DRAFT_1347656 [Cyathus striatus]
MDSSDKGTAIKDLSTSAEAPPRKRVRLHDGEVAAIQPQTPPSSTPQVPQPSVSHLQLLPVELLAEILIYTRSPKDVLAVTRTSKSLWATLTNPNSNIIWRMVRKEAVVPIPDPLEIFSEVTYASFLFDSGRCEVCNEETELPYTSFALRLRLCPNRQCLKTFVTERVATPESESDRTISLWIPTVESDKCILPDRQMDHLWPHFQGICRGDVLSKASREYAAGNKSPDYIAGKQQAIKQNKAWMEFCVRLYKWRCARTAQQKEIKDKNDHLVRVFSEKNGWTYRDVLDSIGYGVWHQHKCKIMELISIADLNTRRKDIDEALLAVNEKRKHRARASAQQKNRQGVKTHWERLRSASTLTGLPSLSAFRTLPVISLIQDSETITAHTALSNSMKKVLEEQLKKWTEDAMAAFDKMLGFQGWKTANSKMVHPCRRFSSRFQCKLCRTLPDKYLNDGCLDFDGVCVHECPKPKDISPKKKWKPPVWNPDNFEIDQRASLAAKMLLQLLNISDEKQVSLNVVTDSIVCQSCKPVSILHARSVVGHSHRHLTGEFSIRIASPEEYTQLICGYPPVGFGMALKLLQPSFWSRRTRDQKKFGCRICSSSKSERIPTTTKDGEQPQQQEVTTATASNRKDTDKNTLTKKPALFIWNGIRSHLKEKHRIDKVRDEDFYLA